MKYEIIIVSLFLFAYLNAQVGITITNRNSAVALDIQSGMTSQGL